MLLLTSKGAATVTGGGFITLAATLATMNGNSVATIFVAWWEGTLDAERARRIINREEPPVAIEG